jgi:hypothetical protein
VHYTTCDLTDVLSHRPLYELDTTSSSPLSELGGLDLMTGTPVGTTAPLNAHYRPWPGNPSAHFDTGPPNRWRLELKDPLVRWSPDWDFPTNQLADPNWIGRVHRGTPWQTLYLKSSGIDLSTWQAWTGDTQLLTNWDGTGRIAYDAAFTAPTNDWRLASLVLSLLNPNDPRALSSVNQPDPPSWGAVMDGMTVLTNVLTDQQLKTGSQAACTPRTMTFDSPQAALIGSALSARRVGQPGQRFNDPGALLGSPELSVASPWLNLSSTTQQQLGVTEQAYESIPSQLLPLLRPDSFGSLRSTGGGLQVQFSGADGYAYALEVSSNLAAWTRISTNQPSNGVFQFQEPGPLGLPSRFYRSSLLP